MAFPCVIAIHRYYGVYCHKLRWQGFLSNFDTCPKRFENSRQCCVRWASIRDQVREVIQCGNIQIYPAWLCWLEPMVTMLNFTRRRMYEISSES